MDERLTSLERVKNWLGEGYSTGGSDVLLTYLIESVSQFILNYLNRPTFKPAEYVERFRGTGVSYHILKNWPVLSITSVGMDGNEISAAELGQFGRVNSAGYILQEVQAGTRQIDLHGSTFYKGGMAEVLYVAGHRKILTSTVPADPYQVDLSEEYTSDLSLTIDGVDGVKVDADPVAGEYAVSEWGIYTFAAADEGAAVEITYSYAPEDIAYAATELVGEWFKKKERIGVTSKTLARQETINYTDDIPKTVVRILQPYRRVTPN